MTYRIFPNQETIKKFKVKLTNGEQALLNYLKKLFDQPGYRERDFEIHVQSNLFFGKPDFIVIEPGYSVWIIEVKDYRRGSYQIEFQDSSNEDFWWLCDQTAIPSPIQQVEDYKQKFIEYAGPAVSNGIGQGGNKYGLAIRTAVFFYNLLPEDFRGKPNHTTLIFSSSFINVQSDNIVQDFFKQTWKAELRLSKDELQEIRAIINPGDNGRNVPLSDFVGKYGELCKSSDERKKIKGVAGTGKTSVLAKRAINSSLRLPKSEILVTCFNITMCNYLQDKIVAEGGKSLNELGIRIQHFHSLYKWKRNGSPEKYVIKGKVSDDRYHAVLIDEGQDFERKWFDLLIQDYLVDDKREFVIFADKNQNIYDRGTILDEDEFFKPQQLPNTPIPGRWNELNEVQRTSSKGILSLLKRFSRDVLQDENEVLGKEISSKVVDEQTVFPIDLTHLPDEGTQYQKVIQAIDTCTNYFIRNGAVINDIVILSTNKDFLKEVEFRLRKRYHPNNLFWETTTTFKPKENEWEDDKEKNTNMESKKDRPYKYRFYRNNGPIKFATVHSFKGWENPYVILILPPSNRKDLSYNYLVYTGLSRANKKLVILNLNTNYTDFFIK